MKRQLDFKESRTPGDNHSGLPNKQDIELLQYIGNHIIDISNSCSSELEFQAYVLRFADKLKEGYINRT